MEKIVVPKIVDISEKDVVRREALAEGTIRLRRSTMKLIEDRSLEKGDPLQIASVAAMQAIKSTPSSLVLCHPIPIEGSSVKYEKGGDSITIRVSVVSYGKTGVEMEALHAVSVALLNVWDVVKKYEKDEKGEYPDTSITNIRVLRKTKG
jgi:cyclic pyranopterin phosphate synthase